MRQGQEKGHEGWITRAPRLFLAALKVRAREKWVGFTLVALHRKATKANPTHFERPTFKARQKLVWEPLFSQPEAFLLGLGTEGPLS